MTLFAALLVLCGRCVGFVCCCWRPWRVAAITRSSSQADGGSGSTGKSTSTTDGTRTTSGTAPTLTDNGPSTQPWVPGRRRTPTPITATEDDDTFGSSTGPASCHDDLGSPCDAFEPNSCELDKKWRAVGSGRVVRRGTVCDPSRIAPRRSERLVCSPATRAADWTLATRGRSASSTSVTTRGGASNCVAAEPRPRAAPTPSSSV